MHTLTSYLERQQAPGLALAWQLGRLTGYDMNIWLRAALPETREHCPAFLVLPYALAGPTALDIVKSAGGPAGDFWREPHLDEYAKILGWPPALLAHLVCGGLKVTSPRLIARIAIMFGVERYCGVYSIPADHPCWVRSPRYTGGSR